MLRNSSANFSLLESKLTQYVAGLAGVHGSVPRRVSTLQPSSSSGKPSILKANNLLGCNESCGHLRKCDDTFRNALECQENKERGPHNVKKLSAPCAEICDLDSQVAAMRMFQSSKCTIILRKSPPSTENDCLTPSPRV